MRKTSGFLLQDTYFLKSSIWKNVFHSGWYLDLTVKFIQVLKYVAVSPICFPGFSKSAKLDWHWSYSSFCQTGITVCNSVLQVLKVTYLITDIDLDSYPSHHCLFALYYFPEDKTILGWSLYYHLKKDVPHEQTMIWSCLHSKGMIISLFSDLKSEPILSRFNSLLITKLKEKSILL